MTHELGRRIIATSVVVVVVLLLLWWWWWGGWGQIELRWKLSFTKFEKTEKKRKWLKQISCPLEVFCKGR